MSNIRIAILLANALGLLDTSASVPYGLLVRKKSYEVNGCFTIGFGSSWTLFWVEYCSSSCLTSCCINSTALNKPLIISASINPSPLSYSPTQVSTVFVIPSSPISFLTTRGNGGTTDESLLTSQALPSFPIETPSFSGFLPLQDSATLYIIIMKVSR